MGPSTVAVKALSEPFQPPFPLSSAPAFHVTCPGLPAHSLQWHLMGFLRPSPIPLGHLNTARCAGLSPNHRVLTLGHRIAAALTNWCRLGNWVFRRLLHTQGQPYLVRLRQAIDHLSLGKRRDQTILEALPQVQRQGHDLNIQLTLTSPNVDHGTHFLDYRMRKHPSHLSCWLTSDGLIYMKVL